MQIAIREATFVTAAPGGTADGYVTVADNSAVFPGSLGSIVNSDQSLPQMIVVSDLAGTTKVGLRFINSTQSTGPSYGHSSCASYPAGAILCIFKQTVSAQPIYRKTS